MEVKKAVATSNKTASTIDFSEELKGLSKDQKEELLDQIGELLIEETLSSVADSRSPVDGSSFAKLSKQYAKYKESETGSTSPNLDLTGSMLSSLEYNVIGDKIEIGVYGKDAPKADGHNNISGQSNLPERQFIPKAGEGYSKDIENLISDTIDQYIADNAEISKKKLDKVESKDDLYELLREELGDYTNKELKALVMRSELASVLDDFDLLDYL